MGGCGTHRHRGPAAHPRVTRERNPNLTRPWMTIHFREEGSGAQSDGENGPTGHREGGREGWDPPGPDEATIS